MCLTALREFQQHQSRYTATSRPETHCKSEGVFQSVFCLLLRSSHFTQGPVQTGSGSRFACKFAWNSRPFDLAFLLCEHHNWQQHVLVFTRAICEHLRAHALLHFGKVFEKKKKQLMKPRWNIETLTTVVFVCLSLSLSLLKSVLTAECLT